MSGAINRRDFVQLSLAGSALCLGGGLARGEADQAGRAGAGWRTSQARIARLYLGTPGGHWPTPKLGFREEICRYEEVFAKLGKEFADVTFVPDALVTSADEVSKLQGRLAEADGILAIHLSMGITPMLAQILAVGKPTMFFAAPYSRMPVPRVTKPDHPNRPRKPCQ